MQGNVRKKGWSFLVAGGAKVSLYLPPRGWEFFGCRQGEGVSLPITEGIGSFWVASRARVFLYLLPRGMGVFWLRVGKRSPSAYRRRGRSRKTPTPQAGWAVVGDCGPIIGSKRILYLSVRKADLLRDGLLVYSILIAKSSVSYNICLKLL